MTASPTVQTSYSERMAPPSPGTLQSADYEVETGICETVAGIPFGRAVSQGSDSDQGVILGGTLAGFRGIAIKDITLGAEHDKYLVPNSVGVMRDGDIWVEPDHSVAANDLVYFSATTGELGNQAGGHLGPIKGARWKTSCGTGGRAVVTIEGYNRSDA